ncbi:GNAT family N-acetyltransferase [Cellulomonas alba]|uniref:GNAT family N-acetyltransferase n=1 Tax=Cellulomonas alba TaxID=3053467 RepID=A0ABT7SCY6_9CELL|nr:GNAT family N-acetyltransferase [Cellulomonas alba]MDM7853427.1 GNAT family N-acetyltransferase [Cellulomonas alba]
MTSVRLPERWRTDRLVLSDAAVYSIEHADGDDDAVLLSVAARRPGTTVVGRGDAARVRGLLDERLARGRIVPAGWMSVPRGTEPGAAVLAALGLERFSSWDWLVTDVAPAMPRRADGGSVVELDRRADAEAIRACLAAANPSTSADPSADGEAAWFGARAADGELLGVIGASLRGGRPTGGASWHLHGLGVRPAARTSGWGSALTAAATRTGLERGAAWVSLGMYADNHAARRIYERLGFVGHAEFDSYGPAGSARPPA